MTNVLELPRGALPDAEQIYIAFLEEMLVSRPDVFNLGTGWFVRERVYAYVNTGREHDVGHLLPGLLDETYWPEEAVFDLIDLLRLAGLQEESRALSFAAVKHTSHGGFMGWAVEELIGSLLSSCIRMP